MKHAAVIAALSLSFALGQGPQPFGLKGDVLGETIQEFRAKSSRVITSPYNAEKVVLPVCMSDWRVWESEAEQRAGVLHCRAHLSNDENFHLFLNTNRPLKESLELLDVTRIAGLEAYQVIYSFFRDRLYKIQAEVPRDHYQELRAAFVGKYGRPSVDTLTYQNGFGATFSGEELFWENAVSSINIGERDGDNILENKNGETRVTFVHKALKKECETAGAVKDRSKDL